MTWIRLDTDFPRHALIGTLSEKLRIDRDRAAMSLLRVWCHFAEMEPHGVVVDVSDLTIEDWAGWRGPRGRFALVFREYCVEPDGKLRGWWRQEKLLAHQEEKRKRRKPAKNRQETGAGSLPTFCPESADNEDGDVNAFLQSVGPAPTGRLIAALGRDPDRAAVIELFQHLPPEESPEVWSGILLGCLQGGMAQGKAAPVRALAIACTDYPAVAKGRWNPAHFRGCVQREMNKMNRTRSEAGGKAEATIDTARKWAEGAA